MGHRFDRYAVTLMKPKSPGVQYDPGYELSIVAYGNNGYTISNPVVYGKCPCLGLDLCFLPQ